MVDFGRALLGGVQGLGQGLIEQNTVREKERVLKGAELRAEKRAKMKANRDAKAQGIQNELLKSEKEKDRTAQEGLLNRRIEADDTRSRVADNRRVDRDARTAEQKVIAAERKERADTARADARERKTKRAVST